MPSGADSALGEPGEAGPRGWPAPPPTLDLVWLMPAQGISSSGSHGGVVARPERGSLANDDDGNVQMNDLLEIGGRTSSSRLLTGTGKHRSPEDVVASVEASVMEAGGDIVFVNTAIAQSQDPAIMEEAFNPGARAERIGVPGGANSAEGLRDDRYASGRRARPRHHRLPIPETVQGY